MEKKHILVVEDDAIIAKVLRAKLESSGFEVSTAGNGKEALTLLTQSTYDLILLDILMPEVDGWEVLEQLRGKNQKVIVTSNLGQPEDVARAKQLGALTFVIKSETSLNEIVDKVHEFLTNKT